MFLYSPEIYFQKLKYSLTNKNVNNLISQEHIVQNTHRIIDDISDTNKDMKIQIESIQVRNCLDSLYKDKVFINKSSDEPTIRSISLVVCGNNLVNMIHYEEELKRALLTQIISTKDATKESMECKSLHLCYNSISNVKRSSNVYSKVLLKENILRCAVEEELKIKHKSIPKTRLKKISINNYISEKERQGNYEGQKEQSYENIREALIYKYNTCIKV
jgi:hypothetical protein